MSDNLKVPPDMIIVRPDGTVQEVYFKSSEPKQNDYNPQLNLYKKLSNQTCTHCKVEGRIWGWPLS